MKKCVFQIVKHTTLWGPKLMPCGKKAEYVLTQRDGSLKYYCKKHIEQAKNGSAGR